jgi:hypothetical protein
VVYVLSHNSILAISLTITGFWINLPIGGITAIVLSLIQIPNASEASTSRQTFSAHFNRLDFPGLLFFAPTCIMLLLALDWGGVTYPWSSATVIGLFCGCVGALIVFLLVERYQKDIAMIPLSMLRMPIFSCAGLTAALNSGSLVTTTFYLPIWFQSVKNVGPILSGVYILPMIGSVILSSVLTGQLGILSLPSASPPSKLINDSISHRPLHLLRHSWLRPNGHFRWSLLHPRPPPPPPAPGLATRSSPVSVAAWYSSNLSLLCKPSFPPPSSQ